MPTNINDQVLWVMNGDYDAANETEDQFKDRKGELGKSNTVRGVRRTRVFLDSGATALTPAGAVAAGHTAFWKDRTEGKSIVTNDVRFSDSSYNGLAGVFGGSITAGRYCFVIKKRRAYSVKATGSTWNTGDVAQVYANASNAADVERIAAGTAPGYPGGVVGVVRGSLSGGKIPVDIDIPDIG